MWSADLPRVGPDSGRSAGGGVAVVAGTDVGDGAWSGADCGTVAGGTAAAVVGDDVSTIAFAIESEAAGGSAGAGALSMAVGATSGAALGAWMTVGATAVVTDGRLDAGGAAGEVSSWTAANWTTAGRRAAAARPKLSIDGTWMLEPSHHLGDCRSGAAGSSAPPATAVDESPRA